MLTTIVFGEIMDFKDKVKKARTELELTQKSLAKELGVTFLTINRWENGKTVLHKLAMQVFYDFCGKRNIRF